MKHGLSEPYIPEQIIDYFESISGLRADVYKRYITYRDIDTFVVVGYPIKGEFDEEDIVEIIQKLSAREEIENIIVIAPSLPRRFKFEDVKSDNYYRLVLPLHMMDKKLRYMVSRASRELTVDFGRKLTKDHKKLMEEFLKRPDVEEFMNYVCGHLENYLSRSETVKTIDAYTKDGGLAGFDIVDLPPGEYSFYMFNFVNRTGNYVPGVSDLLLYYLLKLSYEEKKKYVNMGLGINEGVVRFKMKWGATPFLSYQYGVIRRTKISKILDLYSKL